MAGVLNKVYRLPLSTGLFASFVELCRELGGVVVMDMDRPFSGFSCVDSVPWPRGDTRVLAKGFTCTFFANGGGFCRPSGGQGMEVASNG